MIKGCVAMLNDKVRINKITLRDLKSVAYGVISLNTTDALRQEKASIMGLYGQNASGKTVVIEALAIIKHILSGEQIPPRYLEIISKGKNECTIEVEFLVVDEDMAIDCMVIYKCALARRNDPNESDKNPKEIIAVIRESVRARGVVYGVKHPLQDIARTDEACALVLPVEKCNILFGTDQNTLKFLEQQKILALYGSRSFIFSTQAFKVVRETWDLRGDASALAYWPMTLLISLNLFILMRFVVIDEFTAHNFDFHIIMNFDKIRMPLKMPTLLNNSINAQKEQIDYIEELLPSLNNVLSSIVPGLALEYKLDKISLDEGDDNYRIEFFSCREGLGTFPFKNESLGIKKIVSFIILIMEAYNNPSFTLAVDEMDASIFEYLLGEVLDIMGSSGKGQLLFTSHNLHPLEKLDPHFVWFTTTDPSNRYTQMSKKATNNLRNMYLRAVHLGHGDKELYNGDSKNALAYAFRKMGRR